MPDDKELFKRLGVKNTTIKAGSGVELSPAQKLAVGSVLDLMEGHPTPDLLSLWRDDATFEDPIALAEGYHRYAAQWYGLPAVFKEIKIQSHEVTTSENPVSVNLTNKYVLKVLGTEHTVKSVLQIHLDEDDKITKVVDRWDDNIPDGTLTKVLRTLNGMITSNVVKIPEREIRSKL